MKSAPGRLCTSEMYEFIMLTAQSRLALSSFSASSYVFFYFGAYLNFSVIGMFNFSLWWIMSVGKPFRILIYRSETLYMILRRGNESEVSTVWTMHILPLISAISTSIKGSSPTFSLCFYLASSAATTISYSVLSVVFATTRLVLSFNSLKEALVFSILSRITFILSAWVNGSCLLTLWAFAGLKYSHCTFATSRRVFLWVWGCYCFCSSFDSSWGATCSPARSFLCLSTSSFH